MNLYKCKPSKKMMIAAARQRARLKHLQFAITEGDLDIPLTCPVFGFKLQHSKGFAQYDSPSIDRIDNKKGYIPGNVRIISFRANKLKNDATTEELKLLWEDSERLNV